MNLEELRFTSVRWFCYLETKYYNTIMLSANQDPKTKQLRVLKRVYGRKKLKINVHSFTVYETEEL